MALLLGALFAGADAQGRAPAPARANAASLCAKGFSSDWNVASSSFKLVRTGTWTLGDGGSQATATETDTMSTPKHPQFNDRPLNATEACSPWELALNSFIRPGVEKLSGQWTNITGSGPSQGACAAHRVVAQAHDLDPITISFVGPKGHGFGAFFKNSAQHVKFVVHAFLSVFGLTCNTPMGGASFDRAFNSFNSTVITLSTRMIKRDRSFTLKFSGSGSRTEDWLNPGIQGAREHFDITFSGMLRFRAAGCVEGFFLTAKQASRCAPA